MSYVVSIKREGIPITLSEFESARSGIDGFATEPGNVMWYAEPKAKAQYFMFEDGIVSVTTPSNAALRTMQVVAKQLKARVYGEEGEDLTDVDVPTTDPSKWGCVGLLLLIAGVAYLVWWLFW